MSKNKKRCPIVEFFKNNTWSCLLKSIIVCVWILGIAFLSSALGEKK